MNPEPNLQKEVKSTLLQLGPDDRKRVESFIHHLEGRIAFLESKNQRGVRDRAAVHALLMKTSEDLIRKYQTLFEYSGTAMVVIETDGTISLANSNWENLMGYTLEEVKYKTKLSDFFDELSRGPFFEYHQRLLRGDQDEPSFCEGRIITKAGKVRDVTSRIGIFPGTGQGITSILDITERKQAGEALRASEEKYRSLVENINDVIYSLDEKGVITYISPAIERISGYSPSQLMGHPFAGFILKEDMPGVMQVFDAGMKGTITSFPFRIVTNSGEERWLSVSSYPSIANGNLSGVHGVLSDITERKKAEDLLNRFNEELEQKVKVRTEELNASLDEKVILLREVHHRVKNNLQILISLFNLQSRTITDPKVNAALKESTQRIRAMSLVHEKMHAGGDLAHVEFMGYLSLLANSQISFYRISPGKVKIETSGENIMPDINRAIPLGLVVNELISNALRHAFPGDRKGTISINARETEERLEITLADDGVGMPEGFDLQTATSLGLHLVNILIEQLNGTITLDPAKTGTVYHISIPQKER